MTVKKNYFEAQCRKICIWKCEFAAGETDKILRVSCFSIKKTPGATWYCLFNALVLEQGDLRDLSFCRLHPPPPPPLAPPKILLQWRRCTHCLPFSPNHFYHPGFSSLCSCCLAPHDGREREPSSAIPHPSGESKQLNSNINKKTRWRLEEICEYVPGAWLWWLAPCARWWLNPAQITSR